MQRGFSLPEVVLVLVVIAALLGVAAPRLTRWHDHHIVRRAAQEVGVFYQAARYRAVMRSARVRVEFAADTLRAFVEGVTDSLVLRWPGPARFGVGLTASRTRIRVGPNGVGYGAANTRLVLQRGDAADTLTTSRLGRLKRW